METLVIGQDSPDWIELVNAGADPLDLGGFGLADDVDELGEWTFPALVLDPGALLLVLATGMEVEDVASWSTVVDRGHMWSYQEVWAPPDPSWAEPGFDARSWPVGPSGFGRSDGDDATELWAHTIYLRTELEVTADEAADLNRLLLHMDFDDSFVAYLNGEEIARSLIGIPGIPPEWDAYAERDHEAVVYQGLVPEHYELPLDALVAGRNVLAVEVHDVSAGSSDLSLTPYLSLGFASLRGTGPSWELGLGSGSVEANFSLKAEGEELFLTDPSGCVIDSFEPGGLLADWSYGRLPDGGPDLMYFEVATPGEPNTTEGRPGFADMPRLVPAPGFYPAGVEVTAEVDDPSTLVTSTVDGWEPGSGDPPFSAPVEVRDGVGVIRARGFMDGLWPSVVATGTYVAGEQGTMPVIALTTEPPNLWDPDSGIYVLGTAYDPWVPFFGANFWEDWEVPVHVALWETDGSLALDADAGLVIHGGWSRSHEQRSLRIAFRGGYGMAKAELPLFPSAPDVNDFERLVLRNGGNDWLGCSPHECASGALLRDSLTHALVADHVDVMGSRAVKAVLNGEDWGIYRLRERPDVGYIAEHHDEEDIDLLEYNGTAVEGDETAYAQLLVELRALNPLDAGAWDWVVEHIDVDEYAAYQATQIYVDNTDWPGNNIKFWRPRTADGRWRWLLYDTDFGLGAWGGWAGDDTLAYALQDDGPDWPNPPWSTELFRLLMQVPDFERHFVNTYADLMNTVFTPEHARRELDAQTDELAAEMGGHLARWGVAEGGWPALWDGAWEEDIDHIDGWLGDRPAYARDHVVANLGLAGTWTLRLDVEPAGSGSVVLTAAHVEGPFEGIYFHGVPVHLTAEPAAGWTFSRWEGGGLAADPEAFLDPPDDMSLVAHFE
jgi:hypothetical protein